MTERVSIPIDFRFYQPDPVAQQWRREDRRLRRQGLPKRQRPQPPARDPRYPSKLELALALLAAFRQAHPQVRVRCVVADALYSSGDFLDRASALFDGVRPSASSAITSACATAGVPARWRPIFSASRACPGASPPWRRADPGCVGQCPAIRQLPRQETLCHSAQLRRG